MAIQRINLDFSKKDIPVPTREELKKMLVRRTFEHLVRLRWKILAQLNPDKFNKGLKHMNKTVYSMFVDDSLFAQVSDNIKHAMAASIEALYIMLGYAETEKDRAHLV